jgi:hypothetical protein
MNLRGRKKTSKHIFAYRVHCLEKTFTNSLLLLIPVLCIIYNNCIQWTHIVKVRFVRPQGSSPKRLIEFRLIWYGRGIALAYAPNDRGFESWQGLGIFLFTTASRPALGSTQPPIQWVPRAFSVGAKRPGREADHSPPSSAEVKNAWSYTTTPPVHLNGVVLS